jgi:hypothetical protein
MPQVGGQRPFNANVSPADPAMESPRWSAALAPYAVTIPRFGPVVATRCDYSVSSVAPRATDVRSLGKPFSNCSWC